MIVSEHWLGVHVPSDTIGINHISKGIYHKFLSEMSTWVVARLFLRKHLETYRSASGPSEIQLVQICCSATGLSILSTKISISFQFLKLFTIDHITQWKCGLICFVNYPRKVLSTLLLKNNLKKNNRNTPHNLKCENVNECLGWPAAQLIKYLPSLNKALDSVPIYQV